jgi:signal transduction histidine kinase
MIHDEHDIEPAPWFSLSRSAFWKVAGILVGVQVATGLLAVGLSAYFAYDRSLNLVEKTIRVRLDDLAGEVERRAFPPGQSPEKMRSFQDPLPASLLLDLTSRFPDPISLLDENGDVLHTIQPNPAVFRGRLEAGPLVVTAPSNIRERLERSRVHVRLEESTLSGETTWAMAPIYDASDRLVGGLLVQPLTNSIRRELADTNSAYLSAFLIVITLSFFTALIFGAVFTWLIVKPLRDVMQQVERFGAGDYSVRIALRKEDEFGRLASVINLMADQVSNSVEALRANDILRRQMIANFGHDLRTPLAALLGYLEETRRYLDESNKSSAAEALDVAERQGKYLQQLVGDLFELSLLDSANAPLRREPIPLGELLSDAASSHRRALEKAEIAFSVDLSPALPMIEGDGVRLLRVLDNLLSNAMHHTPPGGTMELAARVDNGHALIEVRDTGCGMTPEVLEHIFDRYYTGTDARTRRRGTGLGLPISSAIAKAHGGTLTARSTPGEGSTFTLALPLNGAAHG